MFRSNVINILGIFAILALSFIFLIRAGVLGPGEMQAKNVATHAARPANAVVIQAFPPDTIIIEALPVR